LCGAATAALLFKSLMIFTPAKADAPAQRPAPEGSTGRSLLCAAATMLFAFSPAFWKGSIQAEVFTLNTLFAALIIYAVLAGAGNFAAFALGLGLGNHHTLAFLSPLVLADLFAKGRAGTRKIVVWALLFLLGFSIYAYLPARASKKPQLNWGDPETIPKIVRVVSRADYGSLSLTVGEKIERNAANTCRQLERFAVSVSAQFTLVGLLLGLLGIYYGLKNRYSNFKNIFFVWLLAGPGFMLLANMPFDPQTEGILERFYILVNLFWAFFILAGLEGIFGEASGVKSKAALFAAASLLLVALRAGAVSWRGYYLAYDYGRNVLRTLSPGSALFMDGGDDTFYSTAYLSFAEGRRRDVELHDRGGLVFKNVYGADFRQLPRDMKENRRREIERAYFAARPVYFSTFNKDVMPGTALAADGVLYRPAAGTRVNSYFAYSLRNVYDAGLSDYRSRALAPIYPYFEASYDPAEKSSLWRGALLMWPDAMWLKGNLKVEMLGDAYNKYSRNDFPGAEKAYLGALAYFPGDYETIINLGVVYEKMRELDKAVECYERAARLEPGKTDAYYNIAVIYWQRSEWANAVKQLNKMLEINPSDERALRYLPIARAKLSRDNGGGK